jgi:hypothetical protein
MTSLRIDEGKSAKVWAKRLNRFLAAMGRDGAELAFNTDTGDTGVLKDGALYSEWGEDVTDEL